MSTSLIGVLPVSGINVGLALAPPILQAEITDFGIDLSKLTLAIAAQIELGLNVPNFAALAATLAQFPPTIAGMLNPSNMLTLGASLNLDLALQLGLIDATLALALSVKATIEAGLSTGGIAAWTYSGPASGLAALAPGSIVGNYTVGLIVATENPSSWCQFSVSVNTGPSKTAAVGGPPTLTSLGELSGGEISTGLLSFSGVLDLYLLKLTGMKAAIAAQIELTVGVNLPDPSALLALCNQLIADVAGLLDNLVNANVDLSVEIGTIQLRLDYILALSLSIGAQLSAGGLALWSYSGTSLGADVATAIAGGVPGGGGPTSDIRALILGCATPSVWAPFGLILGGF